MTITSGSEVVTDEFVVTPPVMPGTPTLNVPGASSGQVRLSWNAASDATSYNVYQGTGPGGESTTPVLAGITATSATVTGLANGTTYFYVVRAVNRGVLGNPSNEVSATPVMSSPPVTPPVAPPSGTSSGGGAPSALAMLVLAMAAGLRRRV